MSRLICSLPALHELSIGSGSSQLTDKLTEKVLQQAVPQTWIGKVLSVESSSPATLNYVFGSSRKLSSAKSPAILESLYLIHRPSGNTVSTYLYTVPTVCTFTSALVTTFLSFYVGLCIL